MIALHLFCVLNTLVAAAASMTAAVPSPSHNG